MPKVCLCVSLCTLQQIIMNKTSVVFSSFTLNFTGQIAIITVIVSRMYQENFRENYIQLKSHSSQRTLYPFV